MPRSSCAAARLDLDPRRKPLEQLAPNVAVEQTERVLAALQPAHRGYLLGEATLDELAAELPTPPLCTVEGYAAQLKKFVAYGHTPEEAYGEEIVPPYASGRSVNEEMMHWLAIGSEVAAVRTEHRGRAA